MTWELLVAFFAGGAVALIPIKYVLGPQVQAATEGARTDASRAKVMAAQAVQEVSTLTTVLGRKRVLDQIEIDEVRRMRVR